MAPLLLSSFSTLFRVPTGFAAMRFLSGFLVLWLGLCALTPVHAAGAADAVLSEVSAALAAGQYQEAVTVAGTGLAEAGAGDLTRGRLLIVRGLARQALGANDEALADFTQGLSFAALPASERARALFARGVTLDSLGRLDDAAGDYSAVLRLAPGATYALNNRANVRRRQDRLEDAQRDYRAALAAPNPNPQYPLFGLGQIAEAQGDVDAARSYYSKALAAVPGFPLALDRLIALGAPAEGPAGLTADTGIIVLKPPPPKAEAAIALHPLERAPSATASFVAVATPARAFARAASKSSTQDGASLRPTIVEGPSRAGSLAQLGAWRSEQEARDGWAVARDNAGGLLDGLTPLIVRAEIAGRGVFYRLRTNSRQPVSQFCAALMQKGLPCMAVRGGSR
jgi:tetratricopeptide (TPR) repeat protein